MRVAVREDVALSVEELFDAMARRPLIEHLGGRPGLSLERVDELAEPGPGMFWRLRFGYLGREYETEIRLTRFERAELMAFDGSAAGLGVRTRANLIALSPAMTRLAVTIETEARNLAARLLLQGLRLRRAQIEEQLGSLVGDYARMLEREGIPRG